MANADFEGGCDGRGRGVRHFFGQMGPTQPWLELSRSFNGNFKPLPDPDGGFTSETAVQRFLK